MHFRKTHLQWNSHAKTPCIGLFRPCQQQNELHSFLVFLLSIHFSSHMPKGTGVVKHTLVSHCVTICCGGFQEHEQFISRCALRREHFMSWSICKICPCRPKRMDVLECCRWGEWTSHLLRYDSILSWILLLTISLWKTCFLPVQVCIACRKRCSRLLALFYGITLVTLDSECTSHMIQTWTTSLCGT